MLTREGFVASDMGGQGSWKRSSWKAEAIRRGDLKISGPIPIKEDTPLNEEEERELAETGTLSPVQPQDELDNSDMEHPLTPPPPLPPPPPPPPLSQPLHALPNVSAQHLSLTSHPVEDPSQQPEVVVTERQPSASPPRVRPVEEMARESVARSSPYSPSTPLRSTPENVNKFSQRKKRKSGLRGVFRKMFGRKSRNGEEEEAPLTRGRNYHHSDPGLLLRQSPPREEKTPSGPRISNLPVKELEPLHPLGQHLPFPMNVNAPQASPPQEYIHFDMQRLDIGRRRATLPSVPSLGMQRHSLDDSCVRPPAFDERQDGHNLPSPGIGIGIAVSSPNQVTTPMAHKRRSRSAGALHELAKEGASLDRRRSAEIRYWRQSYASASIYSRPQTARTLDTVHSVQKAMVTEPKSEAVEMSATLAHADEPSPLPHEQDEPVLERQVEETPLVSAFNFGLTSGFSDDETIPPEPAVPEPGIQRQSIEDRVAHLEGNFQSLELSMRRMSSRNNRQTIILSDVPHRLRSRDRDSSLSDSNSHCTPIHQSSNETLNPAPASPILTRPDASSPGSADKVVEKLYEALKYERSARKTLEQQVQSLQHDMSDLHALVNKLILSATATSPSYPTPSPDGLMTSTEEKLPTPRAHCHDNDVTTRLQQQNDVSVLRESMISKFSGTDESSESRHTHYVQEQPGWKNSSSMDDVASPQDVWATPKEEVFSGTGAGGFFDSGQHQQSMI